MRYFALLLLSCAVMAQEPVISSKIAPDACGSTTSPRYWFDSNTGNISKCTACPCVWTSQAPIGPQDWSNITGKPATFTPATHTHAEADVVSLVTDLAGKAAATHTHAESDVANLVTDLAGKASTTHTHNANFACTGTDKVASFNASGVPVCAADQTAAGSSQNLKVSGADYSNSTILFTDVTGLVTSSLPAGTYTINCDLQVSAAATTTGIQIAINGPTQSFLTFTSLYFTAATTVAVWTGSAYDATVAANGTYPVASGGTVRTQYKLNGQVVTTAAGTIAIRARSEVATSAIMIYRGSGCTVF